MFSHESAAALLGLPIFGHPRHIHIFDSRRERSLVYGDVVVHTSVDTRATVGLHGIQMSTVDDVVLDLARVLPPAFGLAVGDAAARGWTIDPLHLVERAASQRNPNGRRRLDWIIKRIDAAVAEGAEQFFVEVLAKEGIRRIRPAGELPAHQADGFDEGDDDLTP